MKLYLDFEPCKECKTIMTELSSPEMLFADEKNQNRRISKVSQTPDVQPQRGGAGRHGGSSKTKKRPGT